MKAELVPVSWERMIRAVQKVRDRMLRAVRALEQASVPYAVVGGNAVAAWVSRADEAAVRDKDRTHLRDLIEVGLVDSGWISRLPAELARRLQKLLNTPEG